MTSAPDTSPPEADQPAAAGTILAPGEPDAGVRPAAEAPGAPPLSTPSGDCGPLLKKTFPALFAGGPKPLKLRIQVDIQERAPGLFSKQALSAFFRRYTGSTSYLIAVSRAKHRFDLDGAPAGELTEEHRKIALDELARRRGNTESRAALEEQQRRNRATLLHDYERTTLTPANFCALKGIAVDELEGYLATARREAAERPPNPRAFERPHGAGPAPGPRGDRRPGSMPRAGERTGPPHRADGRPGSPQRADGRSGQPQRADGRSGRPQRADGRSGQPQRADERPGQTPHAQGRPGQPSHGDGRPDRRPRGDDPPGQAPTGDGRPGQPHRRDGRAASPPNPDDRPGQPHPPEGDDGQPSHAAGDTTTDGLPMTGR